MKTFAERFPGFEIKGLKFFRGNEGHGFNATVYKDGRKLGLVINEGNGGCFNYEMERTDQEMLESAARLFAIAEGEKVEEGMGRRFVDGFVEAMAIAKETDGKLRRAMKNKLVFTLPGDADGDFRTLNAPYDDRSKAHVLKKYPEARILNEVLR